jgi:hypothetical protein
MSTTRKVTRSEAASLCHVSKDTIRRRQADGAFPNAEELDGAWRIPVADLVAAGLIDPWAVGDDTQSDVSEVPDLQHRVAELARLLERERDEVEFLRRALCDALGKAA